MIRQINYTADMGDFNAIMDTELGKPSLDEYLSSVR